MIRQHILGSVADFTQERAQQLFPATLDGHFTYRGLQYPLTRHIDGGIHMELEDSCLFQQ